jgi:hypothetical protein
MNKFNVYVKWFFFIQLIIGIFVLVYFWNNDMSSTLGFIYVVQGFSHMYWALTKN